MKTLADEWTRHEAAIRASGASDVNIKADRLAFYAGAACVLEAVRAMSADDVDEDAAVAQLAYISDEVDAVAGITRKP